jgi:hypothetical protein
MPVEIVATRSGGNRRHLLTLSMQISGYTAGFQKKKTSVPEQ